MAISVGELEATIRLKDQLTAELRKVVGEVERAGRSLKSVGEDMRSFGTSATLAFTAPLAAAGTAAFKFSKDFEGAMVRVQNLSDISADRVAEMTEQIKELGPAVGKGPEELARGLLVVTSTGLRGAEAMQILESAARLSAIGLGEVKDIARAVTSGMVAYGKENLAAADAADKLFVAVVEGGAEANEFAGSLGRVVGVASQIGVSFDEVVSSVATFTRVGVDADEAVTALRGTMMIMLHPTQQAREQLAKLGTSIGEVRAAIREKGLAEALIDLVDLTKGNYDAIGQIIPNVRALAGILANAGSQAGAYREILEKVKDSHGRADEAFKNTAKTLEFRWSQVLAKVQLALVELGEKLAPSFDKFVELAGRMIDKLSSMVDWFSKLPKPIQDTAIEVAALTAALGPLAIIAGNITYALGGLATLFGKIGGGKLLGFGAGGLVGALGLAGAGVAVTNFNKQLADLEKEGGDKLKKLGDKAMYSMEWMRSLELQGQGTGAAFIDFDKLLGKVGETSRNNTPPVAELSEEVQKMMETLGGNAAKDLATLTQAWRHLTPAQRANAEITNRLLEEYEDLRKLVAPDKLPKDIESLWRQFDYLANFEEDLSGHHENLKDAQEAVNRSMASGQAILMNMAQATGNVRISARDLTDNARQLGPAWRDVNGNFLASVPILKDLRQRLAEARKEFIETHGAFAAAMMEFQQGRVYEALDDITTILDNINAAWAQMTVLVARTAKAIIDNLAEGDIFGAIVAGVVGLGQAIGDVLIDAEWEKIGRDVGERLGVAISEGLAKQIEKDSKKFNRTAAILLSLDDIIKEAGGVSEFGITKAIDQLRSAFSFVESGQLTMEQLGEVIEENFGEIIPEAVSKGTGLVRRDMLEVIRLSREWGVESEALGDFLQEQAERVATGFNKIAKGAFGQAFEEFEKFKDALDKDDPLLKDAEALSRAFQEGFTLPTQESLDRLGRLAVTSFHSMIASGMSLVDALDQVGPGLDIISDAMNTFGGFTAQGPIAELLGLRQWVEDNRALAESISGVNDMLVGLHNSGMLNQATFTDLNQVVSETFDRMVAQGLEGNEALLLLQPSLQTLWELQQDFGYAVDGTTQALIDQAVQQGIVGEEMRDVNERILHVLEAIAEVLGADLPDAARRAADAIPDNPFADWQIPDLNIPDLPSFDPSSYHTGGMVERMHQGLNFVRAHSGLMVDEVPAILQTGEAVLNRRATSNLGSGTIAALNGGSSYEGSMGGVVVNVYGSVTTEQDLLDSIERGLSQRLGGNRKVRGG